MVDFERTPCGVIWSWFEKLNFLHTGLFISILLYNQSTDMIPGEVINLILSSFWQYATTLGLSIWNICFFATGLPPFPLHVLPSTSSLSRDTPNSISHFHFQVFSWQSINNENGCSHLIICITFIVFFIWFKVPWHFNRFDRRNLNLEEFFRWVL